MVLGAVGDFLALGFGAQSIVAPLGSTTLVFNIAFAPIMHSEQLTRSDLFNTFVILVGCVVAVAFADKKDTLLPLNELYQLYVTRRFAVYAVVIVVAVSSVLLFIRNWERMQVLFSAVSRAMLCCLVLCRVPCCAV